METFFVVVKVTLLSFFNQFNTCFVNKLLPISMLLRITRCKVSLMQHFINYLKFQALQALEFPSENEQKSINF